MYTSPTEFTRKQTNIVSFPCSIKYVHASFWVSMWSFLLYFRSFLVSLRFLFCSFLFLSVLFGVCSYRWTSTWKVFALFDEIPWITFYSSLVSWLRQWTRLLSRAWGLNCSHIYVSGVWMRLRQRVSPLLERVDSLPCWHGLHSTQIWFLFFHYFFRSLLLLFEF